MPREYTSVTTYPADREPKEGLLQKHLSLAMTGAAFLLVFVRLLAVSQFNVVTFRAILANAGPSQVILGTLVSTLPFILIPIAAAAIAVLRPRESSQGPDVWASPGRFSAFMLAVILEMSSLLLALTILDEIAFFVVLGLVIFFAIGVELFVRYLLKQGEEGDAVQLVASGGRIWRLLLLAALVVFGTFLLHDEPWLVPEVIDLNTQTRVVGYVLDQTDAELVVLTEEDRVVTRLDLDDVESRKICQATSIWDVARTGADYASCPDQNP